MATSGAQAVRTLPPDGTVLEEVISDMQAEYGLPSTPQEYRLVIRSLPEEVKDRNPARPEVREASQPEPDAEQPSASRKTRPRRRRRRGNPTATEVDIEGLQGRSEEDDGS
ncbi:MAG: hypothetical protein ACRDJF_01770 [Actinomycetota bacterium]